MWLTFKCRVDYWAKRGELCAIAPTIADTRTLPLMSLMAKFFRESMTDLYLKAVHVVPVSDVLLEFEQPDSGDEESSKEVDILDLQNELVICQYFGTDTCGIFICLAGETEDEFLYEVKRVCAQIMSTVNHGVNQAYELHR